MNSLLFILVAGISAALALHVTGVKSVGENASLKIMSLDTFRIIGAELEVSISIAVDNPTAQSIAISQPYLSLFYNNKQIGNSLPSGGFKKITAKTRTIIKDINLRIPLSSVPVLLSAMLGKKLDEQKIGIQVDVVAGGLGIRDKKEFLLKELIKSWRN